MRRVTYFIYPIAAFLGERGCQRTALIIAILVCAAGASRSQTVAVPPAQAAPSLAAPLERSYKGETQLHILYVHGMGIETPKHNGRTQDFEVSQEFRRNFCKFIACVKNEFERRDYADEAAFNPIKDPPPLTYLTKDIWKQSPTNDEWHAAAPFVDHYKLVRKNGTVIYVDEINWWPLILSEKCRQILGPETALVDRDKKHLATCSAETVPDSTHKDRYTSYAWLQDVKPRDPSWPGPAVINRWLKHDILDWGFADALLAVGPLHQYLIEGIREIVLDSFNKLENQEFVVVSHSLGSYLMFSALDLTDDPQGTAHPEWKDNFELLLSRTSHAYFMANQLSLLELANLDYTQDGNLASHLQNWNNLRIRAKQLAPQIVAWSDPNDLLTWAVPDLTRETPGTNRAQIKVNNCPAKNAVRWFWLLESPGGAHTKYDQNKHVLRAMVPKSNDATQKINATKTMVPIAESGPCGDSNEVGRRHPL